jgi:hypothetical protein
LVLSAERATCSSDQAGREGLLRAVAVNPICVAALPDRIACIPDP